MSLVRLVGFAVAFLLLAACRDEPEIDAISFGVGTQIGAPMVVLDARVAGAPVYPAAKMAFDGSAFSFPRYGGLALLNVSVSEPFSVSAEWIEVATGLGYEGEALLEPGDLARGSASAIMALILLPGGELVIGSDPLPTSTRVETRDLVTLCGVRRPDLDRNLMDPSDSTLNDFPVLEVVLKEVTVTDAAMRPPCGGQEE